MSLLPPLLGGAFGVIVGAATTPKAEVAIMLGVFFAVLGWAITGFQTGGESKPEGEQSARQMADQATASGQTEPTMPPQLTPDPSVLIQTPDPDAERRWFWFKVKAALIATAVLVAFNYKRFTETPEERQLRDQYMGERIRTISGQEAFDDCMSEGETLSECKASAERARELADKKANTMFGR